MDDLNNCEETLRKKSFNSKINREDGLILQLHHSIDNDYNSRIKFVHADFDHNGDQMCACDHQENIFIVNFHYNKYWLIPDEKSQMAVFLPPRKNLLLIALKTGHLHFIKTESGERLGILEGHTKQVKYISFSNDFCCLTASDRQAIIWNLKSNTQIHHLQLENATTFKHVGFMPISYNIFACYNNDIIHVWNFKTFKILQEIEPSTWKGRNITSISFTRNGRVLVLGGRMQCLVVFSIDTWTLNRIIHLPTEINGVRQIQFIPQLFDGGSNKILGILSMRNTLHFLDMENNSFIDQPIEECSCINKFYCSPCAKYLACIFNTGEMNLYLLAKVIKVNESSNSVLRIEKCPHKPKNITKIRSLKNKKDTCFEITRLYTVLKHFGEYPTEYRSLIWKMILKLPENQPEFTNLVSRGYHPVFKNLEKKYPLESTLSLMNLKRILSVLANWCPLFSQVENFSLFVYPFVQIFHNDPLINFEVILTIIMNWCQYWFEYFPFPPINLTSMIENVLADQDPILLKYLNDHGVTSVLFGWSLMESAFSEVFTRSEWLQFWDHVISNDTSFLIIAAAAYNIYKRCTIMSFKCYEQFEYFYHNQNTVNMNKFLKQCYQLLHKINCSVHPARYFETFKPLNKGTYPIFTCYPKEMIDYQAENIRKMKEEEEKLVKEEMEVIEKQAGQLAQLKQQIRTNEKDIRMKNLQFTYKRTMDVEQNRLTERQRRLNKLKETVHAREKSILNETKRRLMEKNVEERNEFLDRTLDEMNRTRLFNEVNDRTIEEQILQRNEKLFKEREYLQQLLDIKYDEFKAMRPEHTVLRKQHEQVSKSYKDFLETTNEDRNMRQLKLANRITALDNTLQQVELSLAKEMAIRQNDLVSSHSNLKNAELELITRQLENDVASMIEKLAEHRILETQSRLYEISMSAMDRGVLNVESVNFGNESEYFHAKQCSCDQYSTESTSNCNAHDFKSRPTSTRSSYTKKNNGRNKSTK